MNITVLISRSGSFGNVVKQLVFIKIAFICMMILPWKTYAVAISEKGNTGLAQQSITVSGRITNDRGEPLVGAIVQVKGTKVSAFSNANGNFSVNVPGQDAILLFSSLGFVPQEKKVGNNKTINITLIDDAIGLDEVVVIGYGATVSREDLTGSVGTADMADLEVAPVASFDQALAGRIAGVQVLSSDGQPGEEGINITIRGQ